MPDRNTFQLLTELAMRQGGRPHMRPVVEKEILHYDILFALDQEGLLDALTFQGGTCLRLCHGSPRYSEDLDFVGGRDFASADLSMMGQCLTDHLGARYGLAVHVTEPRELRTLPEYREIKVDKWRITVDTAPEQRHIPRQRIKIEVANIPAYSREPRDLRVNYDFLPDGYADMLVLAESLDEVMADKVISLVNCRAYIRNRDIWDLRWLRRQGAIPRDTFIAAKINDYGVIDFPEKVTDMVARLPEIIHGKAFMDELSRFLPLDVQTKTVRTEKFRKFLANEVGTLLTTALSSKRPFDS